MSKDLIIGAILVVIIGSALCYIIKEKKNGRKCIGCPSRKSCCGCSCMEKISDK